MTWQLFSYFALAALILWAVGAVAAWRHNTWLARAATITGLAVFGTFIALMWVSLERPPLRTMGETRLWYSFFLPLVGLVVYARWRYRWILTFSTVMATVFVCVNLFKPEIHDKTLMPALQSPWFAPHVIIYMFAYALLGAAFVMAVYLLFFKRRRRPRPRCRDVAHRPAGAHRLGIHDSGHDFRCPVGQGSLGALLVVGPQRNVGPHHLVGLSGVPAFALALSPKGRPRHCCCSWRHLCCCKCAGGASTTCHRPKARAFTPTLPDTRPPQPILPQPIGYSHYFDYFCTSKMSER